MEYAPLRRKGQKGGEVPQLHRPLFRLTARRRVALHEDAGRAMVTESSTALPANDRHMRLLIIEDDRESADYLVKAFREVGHIADLAGDGEEGLSLAESGDYDVLVVDRMLPKRDGLSLIGNLRDKGNRTPVLILSALGQVEPVAILASPPCGFSAMGRPTQRSSSSSSSPLP